MECRVVNEGARESKEVLFGAAEKRTFSVGSVTSLIRLCFMRSDVMPRKRDREIERDSTRG